MIIASEPRTRAPGSHVGCTPAPPAGFDRPARTILLTGATGYVGGRLLPRLQARGLRVRCLARRPEFLRNRVAERTEIVAGDVLDRPSLDQALAGADTAFYLVHAMGTGADFEAREELGARNFAAAARAQGVKRIVYLGGLGGEGDRLSAHLRSRQEVGRILRESGVPVIELRASIVIGSGSLSYEMIRALVERLPAMVTPRWVRVLAQPIAIDDLIAFLLEAVDVPLAESRVVEVGGADVVSYGDLMREYARQRGLKRVMIPVPFLTPRLSSLWLGLVTPLYAPIGRELVEGIRNPTVVRDPEGVRLFDVRPVGVREAIASARRSEGIPAPASRWSDALSSAGGVPAPAEVRTGRRIVDERERAVGAPPDRVFEVLETIGGQQGWYAFDWMWRLRGAIDRLLGGVGMRRGQRSPGPLAPGSIVDFWRVEVFERGRRIRLAAEMRLPGRAWLEFRVEPRPGGSRIRQIAIFDPHGVAGLLYWYLLYPFHRLIFDRMLAGSARAAERPVTSGRPVHETLETELRT